jgi:hypothetical protein
VLQRAVRRLPPAVYALEGPRTLAAFQARRDQLPDLAETFYRNLARRPRIAGTNEAERFEIHRYADSTVVAVYQIGPSAGQLYRRAFRPTETRQIQLEGLDGNDVFVVENHGSKVRSTPRIRIYGGGGADEFRATTGQAGIRFTQEAAPAKDAFDKLPEE